MINMVLGIHSNVSGDSELFTAGHAWISIVRDGKATVYGLWPDAHPDTVDNDDKSDIRIGMEISSRSKASRYYQLSEAQSKNFDALMRANVAWTYTNTCASWASDIVKNIIGDDVDADDYFGFETPRELGSSINKLELKNPTSRLCPKRVHKNPACSI